MISLERAADIVLQLATENVLTMGNALDNQLLEERAEQLEALDFIESHFQKVLKKEE